MTTTRRFLLLAGTAGVLLMAFRLTVPQAVPYWDTAILAWFFQHRSVTLDGVMLVVTWLGSLSLLGPAAIVIAWRLHSLGKLNQARLLLSALGGVAVLGRIAKWWLERPRPDLHTWLPVLPMDTSYPSLHALQVTAFFLALALIMRRAWFWPVATTTAAIVALSRLYLQVHYPSDIVAGMAGATLWTLAVYWTLNIIDAK
jgi:membrane-associated phospholipid phosphatase